MHSDCLRRSLFLRPYEFSLSFFTSCGQGNMIRKWNRKWLFTQLQQWILQECFIYLICSSSFPQSLYLYLYSRVHRCISVLLYKKNCGTRLELTNHGVRRTLNKIFYSFFHIVIFKMILHYNTCDGWGCVTSLIPVASNSPCIHSSSLLVTSLVGEERNCRCAFW